VAAIRAIGESPDRKSSIGILVIGISGILVTRGLGISESRSPKPRQGGKCHCGASCQHIGEGSIVGASCQHIGGFEDRNPVSQCIAALKSSKPR
jgi:hypothetical protein